MADPLPRLLRSWHDAPASAIVEFDRDWPKGVPPPALTVGPDGPRPVEVAPAPSLVAGRAYGYFASAPGELTFVFPAEDSLDGDEERVFLAGDFNGWEKAVNQPEWELTPAELDGETVRLWRGPAQTFAAEPPPRFKFINGEHLWPAVPNDAANREVDAFGNVNRRIVRGRTGRHLWRFTTDRLLELSRSWTVALAGGGAPVRMEPGRFFYELRTDLPLGARVQDGDTVFRLFAPRAKSVTLHLQAKVGDVAGERFHPLAARAGEIGVWEGTVAGNLHGWLYWYTVEAGEHPPWPDAPARILDPYALAALGREGPGIVLDHAWFGSGDTDFAAPAWQDLVIAEAHVRDLTAQAPIALTAEERRGFTGLTKWVESPEFYLSALGINCVELQPVQEFDSRTPAEYHWGYMPNNYFAPASAYALAPAEASGVHELQELVRAFHRRGLAVVLDVVYNHVGVPNHLAALDPAYYFARDPAGQPTDWSGCGNDLRAGSAMSRRLILDSLIHLIEAYGVDGFRFDLAELLGVEVLREIEAALKRVKPGIILIAEPWSLRGHIAGALRDTGLASWNDGYREFVREYALNRGPADRLEYFLRGSPWYFAKFPAQTVNYVQSHDDWALIDQITENPNRDGFEPTPNDIRRSRLMAAVLFMSLGIPMLAEGQDFLHSKRGVRNTYLRGDLNALDYARQRRHLATHAYFADWIDFRRSSSGGLLRQFTRPKEGFFQFFRIGGSAALGALYNADGSQGAARLFFATNPTGQEVVLDVDPALFGRGSWRQAADQDRFYHRPTVAGGLLAREGKVHVPAMGCGLWIGEG